MPLVVAVPNVKMLCMQYESARSSRYFKCIESDIVLCNVCYKQEVQLEEHSLAHDMRKMGINSEGTTTKQDDGYEDDDDGEEEEVDDDDDDDDDGEEDEESDD